VVGLRLRTTTLLPLDQTASSLSTTDVRWRMGGVGQAGDWDNRENVAGAKGVDSPAEGAEHAHVG